METRDEENIFLCHLKKAVGQLQGNTKQGRTKLCTVKGCQWCQFGLLLWLMTYVGSWFNGMTLVILFVVSIFTLPKVYETYQGPIDQNVNLVRALGPVLSNFVR